MGLADTGLPTVKSFLSYEDASAFAAGRTPPSAPSDATKFYGVAVGRQPGVYTDWTRVQECIMGWKGPKFKKFATRAEAEEFVRSMGIEKVMLYDGDDAEELEPPTKKVKKAPAKSSSAADIPKAGGIKVPVVYTDGSSRGNGKAGAVAGVGVYFGPNDPRFVYRVRIYALLLTGETETSRSDSKAKSRPTSAPS